MTMLFARSIASESLTLQLTPKASYKYTTAYLVLVVYYYLLIHSLPSTTLVQVTSSVLTPRQNITTMYTKIYRSDKWLNPPKPHHKYAYER